MVVDVTMAVLPLSEPPEAAVGVVTAGGGATMLGVVLAGTGDVVVVETQVGDVGGGDDSAATFGLTDFLPTCDPAVVKAEARAAPATKMTKASAAAHDHGRPATLAI